MPSVTTPRLYSPKPVSPETLAECRRVGALREEAARKRGGEYWRPWNADRYVFGCLGEALVAHLSGVDWQRDARGPDSGTDFPSVDVKTCTVGSLLDEGALRRLAASPKWAPVYALVVASRDFRWARYSGWQYAAALRDAPILDYGYGATRVLSEAWLLRGLPPSLR